jgi:hypothetical protein
MIIVQTAISGVSGTKALPDVIFRIGEGGWISPLAGMDVNRKQINLSPLPGIEPLFVGYETPNLLSMPTELSQNLIE